MPNDPFTQFEDFGNPFEQKKVVPTSNKSNLTDPFTQFESAGNPFGETKVDKDAPDFVPGMQRGLQNLQASAYGAGALVGKGLKEIGFEETGQKLQDFGIEGYQRNIAEAQQYAPKHSFKDVYTGEAGIGGAVDWAQGTLGELVPSMVEAAVGATVGAMVGSATATPGVGTAAGAGIGAFAGRTILKKSIDEIVKKTVKEGTEKVVEDQIRNQVTKQALKKLGGKVGMGAAVFPMETGGMYAELLESHGVDAPGTALLFGSLATVMEYAGGNSKLVDTFVDALAKGSTGMAKKSAKEILMNIPQEAMQEGGQELMNVLNTVVNTDEKLLTGANLERIIESMAAGAVGGGAGAGASYVAQAQQAGKEFDLKAEHEVALNKQVDNIFSFGEDKVNTTLQTLQNNVAKNSELLNNQAALDKYAIAANIDPDTLVKQLVDDNNRNGFLIQGIQKRFIEQQVVKENELTNISPEEKQVLDAQNRIKTQREEAALNINEQITNIDNQIEDIDKQFREINKVGARIQDPVDLKSLQEKYFSLINTKNTLLDQQEKNEFTPQATPYTSKEEQLGTVTGVNNAENINNAKASAEVFDAQEKANKAASLKQIVAASGNFAWEQSTLDGSINGLGGLNVDQNGNVVLTRFAQDESALIKDGRAATREEIEGYASSGGGFGVAPGAVPTSMLDNWNETGQNYGGVVGKFTIPLEDMIRLIKEGKAGLASVGNGEMVISGDVASQYLTHINDKEINKFKKQPVKNAQESAEVFLQNQQAVENTTSNEVAIQSAEESAKTFEQAGMGNGQTSPFTNERQVELTDNQQIIVDKNNFEIAKLKQTYNTTIDRDERINVLNQIDALEKVNAGIRTPVENFPQFQTTNQESLGKVGIEDIKKAFPKQTISQAEDGTISVQFKNGKGLTINSIQQADQEFIKLAIETGQMSKNGKILGITVGNEILLNENFANNKTLWHENKHVLDNLGLITTDDDAALNREFNKLRKAGKLEFALSTHKDPKQAMIENRANMFAQIMVNRDAYRSTSFGKVIQRVMDFFDNLLAMGKQTVRRLAREVESGKLYELQGGEGNNEVSFTTDENSTPEQIAQSINPAIKYDGKMDGIPGVIDDLHNFTITLPDGKQPSFSITGEVTSEKLSTQLDKVIGKFNNQFKPVDPNSPNLIKWLGKSKITTPVYHGSPTEFWMFNKDMAGQNTNQAQTGLGFFFAQDKNESAGYAGPGGFNRAFYLKIENPKTINASELPKLRNAEEANAFANRMKLAGHDGIYLKDEGHWIAFDAGQIKSAESNTGDFSPNNNDVRFQVAEENGQIISDDVYNQMFNERNNWVRKIGQTLRMRGTEFKQLLDKGFGSISTRLKNVDPMLSAEIRNLDFRTSQKIVSALRIAHPLLDATKRMSAQDKFIWDAARRNSDEGKIKQIAEKYGIAQAQENLRNVLNQIRQDAIDVGYDVGFIDEYWPRIIKDQEGFLQATKGISNQPVFTNALKMQADKLGLSVEKFQTEYPEVAADIISNTILGRNLGIGGPGNIQARQYETVPPELNKYYMDSDAALMQYIYSMTKKIEVRRFFGKVPERIAGLKADRKRKDGQVLNYNEMLKTATPEAKAELNKRIDDISGDLIRIDQELDKYKLQRDYTENIGAYIDDLILTGRISKDEEKIVRNILDARFHEHGTTGLINAYKNMAYIDVMGSPISALTQIGDLAWAMYVGKVWTPRGLSNTVKNIGKAATKNSEITKEDLGIERIAQEFADGTTLGNAVSWVFKKVGLEKMDSIGKEVLINNALDNYKAMVQTEAGKTSLTKYLKPIFGSESDGVIQDLFANNHSENVKMLLYHRLLDFQPVALSEMPEQYLKSGNGRIFYMLKTYTLKQFDVFRNEAWHKIKTGERDQVIEGIGNMIKLTSLLALANAGADELKDLLLGKDVKFEDHVIENFLTMGGASRYVKMDIKKEGLGTALLKQILPPFKFVNSLSKDVVELRDQSVAGDVLDFNNSRIVESLPLGGKLYYWHYGRGEDYKKSSGEQSFKDVGKEVDMFKRQLENADDKRNFIYANIDKFKQMKLHENFQSALSRNQAVINKLKKVPETTNVIERLGKLKEQREVLLERYFEAAEGLK